MSLAILFHFLCVQHVSDINRLTPNDLYMSRTTPLTSKRCILYIHSTNVGTKYFKHALYSPFFFSSKCSLFHNANSFGSCILHILYTECAEIQKNNSGFKGLIYPSLGACDCVVELPHQLSCSQFVVCWRFGVAGVEWCSFCRLQPAKWAPHACTYIYAEIYITSTCFSLTPSLASRSTPRLKTY